MNNKKDTSQNIAKIKKSVFVLLITSLCITSSYSIAADEKTASNYQQYSTEQITNLKARRCRDYPLCKFRT